MLTKDLLLRLRDSSLFTWSVECLRMRFALLRKG
jgi:hypothetical protein